MTLASLREQFPALARLGESLHRSEIPLVQQTMATDCGAACLTMALGLLGHHVPLEEVRSAMAVGRDGVSARAILETARLFGLTGRGVKIDVADLEHLPRGSILHWSFTHFVVFDRLEKNGVRIVDPAYGRRLVSFEEARTALTGVALLLDKSDGFRGNKKIQNPVFRYLRSVFSGSQDWGRIALMSIFLEMVGLVLPMINGRLIDRVVPRNDQHLLLVLLLGLAGMVVFHFVASITRAQLLLQLRTRFDAKMTFGFLEHMLRLPYAFFERRQSADLQMRVGSVGTIREVLTGAVLSGVIDGVLVVSHLAMLSFLSLKVTAIALVLVGLQGSVYFATRRQIRELASGSVAKQAEAANALNELLAGMESLKASGCEHRASQGWAAKYVDVMNIGLRQGSMSTYSEAILGTLQVVGPMVLLVGGVIEVMDRQMSLGVMLSANALAIGFIHPTMALLVTLQRLQATRVHLTRMDDVLDTAPEQVRSASTRIAPRLQGHIQLDRVSFRYAPKLPLAVKNVTITIQPGECVAIVGRSGSGKTTLGRMLLGLYAPNEGSVRFDGTALAQLDLGSVRRQLGVVVQRPHIFGTTIRANIALGDPTLPLERVRAAAARACIDEDIERMPLQYDTPVVAGGASLSGGQRQRIALARALVEEPAVVLLDEATSALDSITETAVQQQLERLSCTRIFIAHRLSTVVHCDRILVMDEGALVEQGTHAELLAKGGAYARLVGAQLSGPAVSSAKPAPKKSAVVRPIRAARQAPQLLDAVGAGVPRFDPDAPTWHGDDVHADYGRWS